MRKLLFIAVAVSVGCGSQTLKDQSREAMPDKTGVAMGSPKQTAQSSALNKDQTQQDSTVGQHSTWFDATLNLTLAVNGGTAWVLDLVAAVTANEPTSCTGDTCTWGPGSGALDYNNWMLVVTRKSDGSFHYELSGQPKNVAGAEFTTFLKGDATPSGSPHRGSGSFTIDFDAAQKLANPHGDVGTLTITYDNRAALSVQAGFLGVKDQNQPLQRNNADYDYAADASGGGDMQIAVHNLTTDARFSLHSRWKSDGEGRADVNGSSASPAYSFSLSECWGVAPFAVVYFTSDVSALLGPDSGAETACAFPTAAPVNKQAP